MDPVEQGDAIAQATSEAPETPDAPSVAQAPSGEAPAPSDTGAEAPVDEAPAAEAPVDEGPGGRSPDDAPGPGTPQVVAPQGADATQQASTEELAGTRDAPLGVEPEIVGGGLALLVALVLAAFFALRGGRPQPTLPPPPAEERELGGPVAAGPAAEDQVTAPLPAPPTVEPGLVGRLREALGRTRAALQGRFDTIFSGRTVDEDLFEELEMALLSADVGVPTTERLLSDLRDLARSGEASPEDLRTALRDGIRGLFAPLDPTLADVSEAPLVVLVVGVNGSGKTTTIGKLAARFRGEGKRVMLAAADTYRAAAAEQLAIWADRADADIVKHQPGADPGAVAYDALQAAKARGHDVVIVDTAGRLQTRKPLMEQLSKVRRVIGKVVPEGPHETLLVLDGTMGQNALSQAQLFNEATPLTGAVVTKLDGTAKGGMILTIASELSLPVKFIGIGEKTEDLRPFDADDFVEALA